MSEQSQKEEAANAEQDQSAIRMARQTMVGDLRDVCINLMKDPKLTGKAWKDMKEAEQREVIAKVVSNVESAVIRAVDVIRAGGRPNVKALMKQVIVKDGVKIQLECSKLHERFHDLVDAQGDHVLLVLSDTSEFMGSRGEVKVDKDQPELPIKSGIQFDEAEEEEENDVEESTNETKVESTAIEADAAQYT